MDTSELYIRMSDCPEIQDGWEAKYCDIVCDRENNRIDNLGPYCRDMTDYDYRKKREQFIWLPYQHQLQEMVKGKTIWELINSFSYFCNEETHREVDHDRGYHREVVHTRWRQFDSLEIAWLCFAMRELHNKKWDGEKWITQTA